jgi:MYXO-CTERM domain-containing protein
MAPAAARAQIGDGWTPLTLDDDYIDTQSMGKHQRHPIASLTTSGARYIKEGDSETFELFDPSFNRVEHDSNHHYRTGKVQFEGIVQIYPGVNHQFIVQNFNAAGSGPIMALSAFSRDGGVIIKQGGSVEVARNAFGRDIRVNIIHDLDANTLAVYIDGLRAWAGAGGQGGGGFNFKYGSYGSLNGSTSAKARWKNVKFFTGGNAGGNAGDAGAAPDSGRPADAGAGPDTTTGADTGPARDSGSGTGGAGGTGGASGSGGTGAGGSGGAGVTGGSGGSGGSGSGGAGGSGGRAGSGGGSGGSGPIAQPGDTGGCGCDLGGDPRAPGSLAVLVGAALLFTARRRQLRGRRD